MILKIDLKKSANRISIPTITFFVGILLAVVVNQAMAAFGDDGLIHACVPNGNGSLRIVNASDTCNANESEHSWSSQIFPIMCPGCSFPDNDSLSSRINGKNLTNALLNATNLSNTEVEDINFTNADLRDISGNDSDFTNINFTGANLERAIFTNSNLTNINFTDANLNDAIDMDTVSLTSITWDNTICPDGTNSDSHSNTCAGHLTP